ncbi:MAG: HAD family hydrolase [Clostridia bacterium]|nr:HAD family hydrolase [Clostridia bacterium]
MLSDYDGTVAGSDGVIAEETKEALRYFTSEGGLFTVSTGRSFQGFPFFSPDFINCPVLLANGALAYDYRAGKKVFFDYIDPDKGFLAVNTVIEAFPEVSVEMYGFGTTYCIHPNEMTLNHFGYQELDYRIIDRPEQAAPPWVKIMIGAGPQVGIEVQRYLDGRIDDPAYLATYMSFVELMKKGVNKGTGLKKLARFLGVKDENIYSVGDGYNDVDMLKASALSFCPSNGEPEALEAADVIVRSNSDGAVIDVIERLEKLRRGK